MICIAICDTYLHIQWRYMLVYDVFSTPYVIHCNGVCDKRSSIECVHIDASVTGPELPPPPPQASILES